MRRVTPTDIHVLLLQPDDRVREEYAEALEQRGIAVAGVSSGAAALQVLDVTGIDVLVSDAGTAGVEGAAILSEIREREPDLPLVLTTPQARLDTAILAVNLGAYRYLVLPVGADELESVVRRAAILRSLARLRHEATAVAATEDPKRHILSERFSRALNEIWMAYQPIVDARDRSLLGFEALLRVHAEGFVGPEALIAAAHSVDRARDLGRVTRALIAKDADRLPPDAQVFVNLLPTDLLDPELYDASQPLGAMAGRVVLELTERSSLDAIPDLPRRVGSLRAMGFRIALDDLGAGYSGLASLTQLEPEIVKLDRSLIRGVHRSVRRRAVVRSVVALCESLDIVVIGEGVEWEAEAEALRGLQVDHLQGFLIALPDRSVDWPRAAAQ